MNEKWRKQPCPRCGSPDRVINPQWLRVRRLAAKITLRDFARSLNFSAPYICDVELGRRHCTADILKAYEAL